MSTPRNVVLFTLDCVRPDRLGCYGYEAARTPNIDALRDRGLQFTQVITAANVTDPSHVSILSSTYPTDHGVHMNGVKVETETPFLQEILQMNGYRTAAAVSVEHMSPHFGFDRGFDRYYSNSAIVDFLYWFSKRASVGGRGFLSTLRRFGLFHKHWRPKDETNRDVAKWVKGHAEAPFFMWIHYFDAHYYPGRKEADQDFVSGFDAKVALVDEAVGEVVEMLRKQSLLDDTVFVIMADHGESLESYTDRRQEPYIKGRVRSGHGAYLYDEEIKIPLLISPWPEMAGATETRLVRSIDVAPMVLDLLGIDAPGAWEGASLLPLVGTDAEWPVRCAFSISKPTLATRNLSPSRSVRTEHFKLISYDDGNIELYDLGRDPGELDNIHAEHPERAGELQKLLQGWWDSRGTSQEIDSQEAVEQMLRGLGYID